VPIPACIILTPLTLGTTGPFPNASCCVDDAGHCCPGTHPICDIASSTCRHADGDTVPLGSKFIADESIAVI